MEDVDRELALALQEEYNREVANSGEDVESQNITNKSIHTSFQSNGTKPRSIVDPAWELMDPSPDVRVLFQEFNAMYFWGKLCMVEVRWSPRMTLCAGLCCYEGRGGLCSIRLSKPLLQLRPRKDLVETLLHEMIHALLFITDNNKDHDGHGPEFCKHMNRINTETGTNISIYHNFHDEVNELRSHWWRCDGTCRTKPPYFGYVKRSMNRAPSPRDTWWSRHQSSCGGSYTKVKEPENYGKKKVKEKPVIKEKGPDITAFLTPTGKNTHIKTAISKFNNTTSSDNNDPSIGNRLGGINTTESNGRGIPSFSRLLNTNTKSNSQSNAHLDNSSSSGSKRPLLGDKLDDKWGDLLVKKQKNGEHVKEKPQKRKKHGLTIPELVARMKRKRTKSVSAGASAFKNTEPISSFNNRIIKFEDSQDETQNSSSDKENKNQKIFPTIKQKETRTLTDKNTATNSSNKQVIPQTSKSNSIILPSLDSDDDDCTLSDIYNKSVLPTGDKFGKDRKSILSDFSQTCVISDDELPEIEISRDLDPNDNLTPGKLRNFSKRLPSISDSDENETLPDIRVIKPLSKKMKTDEEYPPVARLDSVEKAACPICCVDIPLSDINSHIDDCLSMKAIKDSAFD